MTGWRIGYAGGPKDLIDRMVRLQGHATSGPPGICQRAALAALTGPQEPVEAMRETFDRRRRAHGRRACAPSRASSAPSPDGAFYALPRASPPSRRTSTRGRPLPDVAALAEAFLDEAKVAVRRRRPLRRPHAIRLSYACAEATIRKGLGRWAPSSPAR